MKKFTETEYYKKWYAQLEEAELKRIDKERILREFPKLVDALEKNAVSFEEKAILYAQCIHRPQLKSPSQAVYPDFNEFDVKQVDATLWEVSGYCDAPNSYGALTRDKFTVNLRYIDGNFEYVIPTDKIHNQMIGVAVILGITLFVMCGLLAPIFSTL